MGIGSILEIGTAGSLIALIVKKSGSRDIKITLFDYSTFMWNQILVGFQSGWWVSNFQKELLQ